MAAIAAGLALALLVALRLGGDDGNAPPRPEPAPARSTDPLSYPRQGLRLVRPVTWTAEERHGVVRLRSPDGTTTVAVLTASRRLSAEEARRDALAAIGRSLDGQRTTGRSVLSIGGLRAEAIETAGRTERGVQVRAVAAAVRGRWRTYSVTIFRAYRAPELRTREIATVLQSIRLHRPTR